VKAARSSQAGTSGNRGSVAAPFPVRTRAGRTPERRAASMSRSASTTNQVCAGSNGHATRAWSMSSVPGFLHAQRLSGV
jgi:hypothetical protein